MNLGKLLFCPVHRKLGGRAAPAHLRRLGAAPEVLKAFRGLGFDLYEGYGMTEAAPVLTVTAAGTGTPPGSVGRALPGIEVRIDEPDANGVGEVLAQGPNVMLGYSGDQASTRRPQVLDGAGCTPATSASSTPTGTSTSSAARRR